MEEENHGTGAVCLRHIKAVQDVAFFYALEFIVSGACADQKVRKLILLWTDDQRKAGTDSDRDSFDPEDSVFQRQSGHIARGGTAGIPQICIFIPFNCRALQMNSVIRWQIRCPRDFKA